MLKTAARLALLCTLLCALPASGQTPAAQVSGPAEALAWRGFQACLQVSRGVSLDKAAAEAGFLKDADQDWVAEAAGRTLTIVLASPPAPPGAKSCVVVSRGPLADHAGFGKRIGGWAGKEGLAGPKTGVTAGGGQALNYATDVDAIITNVLDGNGRRQPGPITPAMFGHDPGVRGYGHDPARARQLLAEELLEGPMVPQPGQRIGFRRRQGPLVEPGVFDRQARLVGAHHQQPHLLPLKNCMNCITPCS
jgi:hypothetical protein